MAEETTKKTYLGKPQLVVKRTGKIIRFKVKGSEQQFYLQINKMQQLCYSKKNGGYAYANEYVPYKTIREEFNKGLLTPNLSPTEPIKP